MEEVAAVAAVRGEKVHQVGQIREKARLEKEKARLEKERESQRRRDEVSPSGRVSGRGDRLRIPWFHSGGRR